MPEPPIGSCDLARTPCAGRGNGLGRARLLAGVTVTRADVGLRSERGPVLGAIMLSTSLVALDSTIIATAVPSLVDDLGGFSRFPWLFSLYLLTQAVTVPVYGKLSDVFGRKPLLIFGIVVFVAASVFCGFAWSMEALIVGRALQGIGAGAIQPIGMTVIGDLYSVEERAKVQGYVASVWAASAVLGPTLGGLLSDYASWRWIFLINLPLGVLAVLGLLRRFPEAVERRPHRLDLTGAGLLTIGCSLLILGLLEGGTGWAWRSTTSYAVLGTGLVVLLAFSWVERRAAEPVLPPWVFRHRILVAGNLAAMGVGALLIGLSTYVPTWVQGVLGTGAVEAGLVLAALTMGWPIAASQCGKLYLRIGFRDTALIGMALALGAAVYAATLTAQAQVWQLALALFVLGLGMGLSSSPLVVAIQSVVSWERRGVVTATNMFSRSIGSAVGAAVFGAIANTVLARRFDGAPPALRGELPQDVDGTARALAGNGPVAEFTRASLHAATHEVFVATAVATLLITVAVAFVPRRTEPLVFPD